MEQFFAGRSYTRADVLRELGLDDPHGGAWYTGLTRHGEGLLYILWSRSGRSGDYLVV
jgi:5-methylcytosine-specific restriction enzyme A